MAIEKLELWKTNWSNGGKTVAGETEKDGSMEDLIRIIKEESLQTPEMGGLLLMKPIPDVDGRSPDLELTAVAEERKTK